MSTEDMNEKIKTGEPQTTLALNTLVYPPLLAKSGNATKEKTKKKSARSVRTLCASANGSDGSSCATPKLKYDVSTFGKSLISPQHKLKVPRPKMSSGFVMTTASCVPMAGQTLGKKMEVSGLPHKRNTCTTLDQVVKNSHGRKQGQKMPVKDARGSMVDVLELSQDTDPDDSSSGDQSFSLERVISEYSIKARLRQDIQGNPEATGELLAKFFADLMKALPGDKDTLEPLHDLAKALTQGASARNAPAKTEDRPIIASRATIKHKIIGRLRNASNKMVLVTSDKCHVATCISQRQADLTKRKLPKRQMTEELDSKPRKISKRDSCVAIPKLRLGEMAVAAGEGYNEEFLKKYDEFSNSWREECHKMKTCCEKLPEAAQTKMS